MHLNILDLIGLILSVLLLAYLTIAMLYPEKF
jgi:K+-transporting ATPase KdpF subunit